MKKRVQWKVFTLLTFVLFVSSVAIPTKQVFACSCAMPESVSEELIRSDTVFDGTVVSGHKPRKWFTFSQSSADPVTWTFEAHEVWKGKVASEIRVISAQSGASCGFEFKEGQRYIVYASGTGDSQEVSLCSRTGLASAASDDLVELGSGSIPPKPAAGEDGAEAIGISRYIMAIALIAAAGAAIYGGMTIKKRNQSQ